ncbi:hypothetical protein BYT27DRAFT_7177119 [Phlegmacium glaucopus]|nr:hypothetical protein BYT27DRAFT_7177119 [Phlegmacium glaucopus]
MTSPGYISVSAITILACPRPVDPQKGARNIVFDANFYIVEGSETSSLGLLRYFVPDDMMNVVEKFSENSFQKAFIIANISSITKDTIPNNLVTEDLEITDYAFVGDIAQLTLIHGDINEKTRPHITAMGTITHFSPDDHSFQMSPSQYIALPRTSSPFPLHGYFLESKRWGDGKSPKLFIGSTIAFGGFIDRISRERDVHRTVSAIEIEVVNIAWLSSRTPSQFSPDRSTTRTTSSRTRWNYKNPSTTTPRNPHNPPSNSPQPQSSKSQRKRKRLESSTDEETASNHSETKLQ